MSLSPLFDSSRPSGFSPSIQTYLQPTLRRIYFTLGFCELVKLILSITLLGIVAYIRNSLALNLIDSSAQTCLLIVSAVSLVTMALRIAMWNTDTSHCLVRHFRKVIGIVFGCDLVVSLLALSLLFV
jgi:hypothetical protein